MSDEIKTDNPVEESATVITSAAPEKTTEELEAELAKYKKNFDKVASELSQTKKLYKERLTEEERKASEQQELQETLIAELEILRKEKKVALITAKVTDLGVESNIANKMAEFYASDDAENFFGHLKAFVNDLKEQIRTESMKGQPSPQSGIGPGADEPDFGKMSLREINQYYKNQGVKE